MWAFLAEVGEVAYLLVLRALPVSGLGVDVSRVDVECGVWQEIAALFFVTVLFVCVERWGNLLLVGGKP